MATKRISNDLLKIEEWRTLYREKRVQAPLLVGMLTSAQARRKYCISGATLKSWRASGLPYKRIGRWIFMSESEIKRRATEYWKSN